MLRSPLRPLLRKPARSTVGLAALDLINRLMSFSADFTNSAPTPAVQTTRSGLATCIGPDGTLQWGPHNLLGESGNLLDSVWYAGGAAYSATTTTITKASAGNYSVVQNTTYGAAGVFILSALVSVASGAATITGFPGGVAGGSAQTVTTTPQRLYFIATIPTAGVKQNYFLLDGGGVVYTLTQIQLENVTGTNRTTPSDYVDSTVKNRLGYSNDPSNAAWVKSQLTVQTNSCTGPSGQPAHTLVAQTGGGTLYQSVSLSGVCTAGVLVRRRLGTGDIRLLGSDGATWYIKPITSEWGLIQNDGGSSSGTTYLSINVTVSGDQIDICDARLVPGTSAANYSYNPGAAPTVGPIYAQRTDYDPVTLACKGALIEAQATQLLANPDNLANATSWQTVVGCPVTDDGKRFRGRVFWKVAKSQATQYEQRYQVCTTSVTGNHVIRFAFLASDNSNQIDFGLYADTGGSWGASGDSTCVIKSGPGTLTQGTGAIWKITGLSTNVPTVVVLTRNYLSPDYPSPRIYPDTGISTTIGKYVYVQVDNLEAGTADTSFIPNPNTSGTVVRAADTSQVAFDDLAKALPWLMDTNILPAANVEDMSTWSKLGVGTGVVPVLTLNDTTYAAPDGTFTADKVVFNAGAGVTAGDESSLSLAGLVTTTGAPYTGYFRIMGSAGTTVIFRHVAGSGYQTVVCSGLGIWDTVPGKVEAALSTSCGMSIGIRQNVPAILNSTATVWLWGVKINPGPVAQQYFPQSSKQGTILFEGDLTFASDTAAVIVWLENKAATANRVGLYKPGSGAAALNGYVNANLVSPGNMVSGTAFKSAIGFSLASAGITLNGSAESAITPSAFAALPNYLGIGNNTVGSAPAPSMHIRRLRIFSQNLPASTKQALTR